MSIKNACVLSGGGYKIPQHIGSVCALNDKGIKIDAWSGVSSGAIVAFLAAFDKYDAMRELALTFKDNQVFNGSPNSALGLIKMPFRLAMGKGLFDQSRLIDTLSKIVSEEEYNLRIRDMRIYIGCGRLAAKDVVYFNLKDYDYSTALKMVLASASIPLVTDTVKIDGVFYLDGGYQDHFSIKPLEKYADTLESVYCGITRVDSTLGLPITNLYKDYSKIWNVIPDLIPGVQKETSINDEIYLINFCQSNNISLTVAYLDPELADKVSTYKVAKHNRIELFKSGYNQFSW
jgi:predicted acylesterase/phospholipase RssA